jgi:NitT/TauT family transport system permease protein
MGRAAARDGRRPVMKRQPFSLADDRRERRPRRLPPLVDKLVAAIVTLAAWQLIADYWVGRKWISSPLQVGERVWALLLDGTLLIHAWQTFQEAILGLVLGTIIGTAAGMMLGRYRRASEAVDPIVMGLYSLPRVSLAPLFIIWLGIGLSAKVALCASIVLFVVLFNIREGMKTVDQDLIDAFRSMNASRAQMMRYVILPSLVPWLITSVRISIGLSLIGAVVGEMMGASRGLGWYVNYATGVYDITGSITALFVLGVMAMGFNAVVSAVERNVLSWRKERGTELARQT